MKGRVTPSSVANAVRLIRSDGPYAVVIAEGDTDARVLRRFIDKDNCRIEIAHGYENVFGALDILRRDGVIGLACLVDKDCMLLGHPAQHDPDVIVTDSHDLETMMFQTDALEKVLYEVGSDEKIRLYTSTSATNVREALLRLALPIGFLRLASRRHGIRLKFDGCDYGAFIDKSSLAIDHSALASEIINRTRQHSLNPSELVRRIGEEEAYLSNPWDVCCGHDMSAILGIALRKVLGSCNPSTTNAYSLESSLRLAYEDVYFRLTGVFRSLRAWELRNSSFHILK